MWLFGGFVSFCAILRVAFLSDIEDDIAVCGTVKAFRGIQGSARRGLGLLSGRGVTAFWVWGVTVVGRQLGDVVRLSVRHLQVAADALWLSQRHVSEPLPDRRTRRKSQR